MGYLDPYPDPDSQSGKCWIYSLLRAEGLSCSLDVLYGGLGIAIFERKKIQLNFFPYFLVIKALDPNLLEMLDPDPDSMNPNPQHC
jgi:hypothetical protein